MKKKFSLLMFCVLISAGMYAAEKVKGQIVVGGNTENVTLIIPMGLFGKEPNTEALQKRVRYLDAKGKKQWLRPDKAKEFSFQWAGKNYRMVAQPYDFQMLALSTHIFLLQLIDGPVKMFEFRQTNSTPGGQNMPATSSQSISYFLKKGADPLVEPRGLGFKKHMSEYFSDCPALVDLIQGKEFKWRDLEEIVLFYNTKCASN